MEFIKTTNDEIINNIKEKMKNSKRITKAQIKRFLPIDIPDYEIEDIWKNHTTKKNKNNMIISLNDFVAVCREKLEKNKERKKELINKGKEKQAKKDKKVLESIKEEHKNEVDALQKQINKLDKDVDMFVKERDKYFKELKEHKIELKKQIRNNKISKADYNEQILELKAEKEKLKKATEETEAELLDKIDKAKKEQKGEDNKILNDMIAKIKHKYKDNDNNDVQAVDKPVINTSTNSPSIKQFLKNTYRDGWYKLTKEEVLNRLNDKKYKQILKDVDKNKLANDIFLFSSIEAGKEANNIVKSIQLGAINPQDMSNLSEETQQLVNDTLIKKQTIDNLNKRLKYKLPINKPKFERAMLQNRINPLVFRGAYSTNERGR